MTLVAATRKYLNEVLGIPTPKEKPWAQAGALPYFLQDAFQFAELELLGHPIVLAITPSNEEQALGDIRARLDKVRAQGEPPVVFVTDALASYERKRLIEQKVPFIVPGNQLYLPDLGLDLREHFRQRAPPAFGAAFWQFVNAGGYQLQQVSDTGKPKFYRFQKPADERYPAMIELFARAPDGLTPAEGSQLTPIPLDEAVSSCRESLSPEHEVAKNQAVSAVLREEF